MSNTTVPPPAPPPVIVPASTPSTTQVAPIGPVATTTSGTVGAPAPLPPAINPITNPPAAPAGPAVTIPKSGDPEASATVVASTLQPNLTRSFITALSGDNPTTREAAGNWSRGWIAVNPEPIDGGVRVAIESGHSTEKDHVKLTLQARVRAELPDANSPTGTTSEERIIDIELLHDGILNAGPNKFDNVLTFDINYAKLQAELDKMAPNAKLKLDPATPLAVQAQWQNKNIPGAWDHNWGGFDRNGSFYLPYTGLHQAPGATGNTDGISGPMPLDIGVTLDETLVQSYQHFDNQTGEMSIPLLKGGQFMSRVESEVKVAVPYDEGQKVAAQLFELVKLVNDPDKAKAQTEALFGKGWTIGIEDVKRFYSFDDQGNFKLDKDGLPQVFPMLDRYLDSQDGKLAEKGIALRFRETPKDEAGLVNIKLPSPATLPNPTGLPGLIGRYDTGIQTVKGVRQNPQALTEFMNSDDNLNAFRHVKTLIPNINASEVLSPAMDLSTNRYKVILKHENGTNIEISLDHVSAVALAQDGNIRVGQDGKPMVATFWQLELDLEHLQTKSTNVIVSSGSSSAWTGDFAHNYSEQQKWLATLQSATMSGPPRVHKPEDVANKSIIESEAYKLLLDVGPKLHNWMLQGGHADAAMQKYATAARLTGIVAMDDAMKTAFTRESEISGKWRDAYEASYKKTEKQIAGAQAEARKTSRELSRGGAVLRNEYTQLANLVWGVQQAMEMAWNARIVDPTRASETLKDRADAFSEVLKNMKSAFAYYARKAKTVKVDVSDEQKVIDGLRTAFDAWNAAHDARMSRYAEARKESDPAKGLAIQKEAEDGLHRAALAAQQAFETALNAANMMPGLNAKKIAIVGKADQEATLLRSSFAWQTLNSIA
jgi:hypothetical protein